MNRLRRPRHIRLRAPDRVRGICGHLTATIASLSSFFFLAVGTALAQAPPSAEPELSTTRHTITVDGRAVDYAAHAGLLPIRLNETGAVQGRVFFTYYELDPEPGAPARPLTFLWNGGPGANSVLVHLEGFGPRRIRTAESPLDPPDCDCALIDNDGTWLGATDLVFVDPIGTGFSRPETRDAADQFYGVREDAAYIGEFIRLFLTRFDAWDKPLFVGGESYGTWRAGGVAKYLEERGVRVSGMILISGGIPVGGIETEEMRVAKLIPARTAAAFHHGRLAADLGRTLDAVLAESDAWATREYAPALARRAALDAGERDEIVQGLARYTGLRADQIDRDALVVNRQEFADELLEDEGLALARFDTRVTTGSPSAPAGARAQLVGRYLREQLGFDSDQTYQGLEQGYRPAGESGPSGPSARWRYNHGEPGAEPPVRLTVGDGPPGYRPAWVRDALERDPDMRVFVATGHFDSLNSCALNAHLVSRLETDFQDNFTLACYQGGHAMYQEAGVRLQMKADIERFFEVATEDAGSESPGRSEPATPDESVLVVVSRSSAAQSQVGEIVTTRHSISLQGRTLQYTAHAGTLPIRDNETGEVRAQVFFVGYSVAPLPGEGARPILFAWNGGPGSNAGLLHMAAMGPRRLRMDDVFATADPGVMTGVVDNEATWLGATDLVFVDPVGTGYSRPTRAEYGPDFYDTVGDVESIAEFIRVYLNRFDAWNAPLLLAGESYGSLRAASVARSLQGRGIVTRGVVFISGDPGLGPAPSHLNAPLLLPSLTRTALYRGKLPADLAANPERTLTQVRDWALGPYAEALANPEDLTPGQRAELRRELARFTGIPENVTGDDLTISGPTFSERLLQAEGRVLGRYDARLSRARKADEGIFDPREDASLAPLENKVSGNAPAMIRYLRYELGYESDLFYAGPFGGAWPPPERFRGDWMSVRWTRSDAPAAPLLDVLADNPDLLVLHASGAYDLVTPAGPPAYLISQLDPEQRDRFSVVVYEGGHSFYLDRTSRMQFMRDGTRLIEAAARAPAPSPGR